MRPINRVQSLLLAGFVGLLPLLMGGCVAIPPLIHVEHKNSNSETTKKLDAIDQRLNSLENKLDQKK
jgi:hypothetical protein